MSHNESKKFCPGAFGFTLGILWGLAMLLLGLVHHWVPSYGTEFFKAISSVYIGFKPTIVGSFIGFAWGFVDFFVFGFLIAYIYNKMVCCNKCSHSDS